LEKFYLRKVGAYGELVPNIINAFTENVFLHNTQKTHVQMTWDC